LSKQKVHCFDYNYSITGSLTQAQLDSTKLATQEFSAHSSYENTILFLLGVPLAYCSIKNNNNNNNKMKSSQRNFLVKPEGLVHTPNSSATQKLNRTSQSSPRGR